MAKMTKANGSSARPLIPKGKAKPPELIGRLLDKLVKDLSAVNIHVQTGAEQIPGTGLYRVYVIGKKLAALRPSERQDLVWRIANQELDQKEQLRISTIFTLTPEEMGWVKEGFK